MAPDLPTPSGGIKVIYRFVEHLCALGHDARVWHGTPGFRYESWGSTAPVDTGMELEFDAGDVLVMPETGSCKWNFLSAGQPVVMLCQGMDFVFSGSDFLTDEPGAYPGWPQATAALAVSDAIHTFLERACHRGFPLHNVPVQVEDWFRPATKEKRIALHAPPETGGPAGRRATRTTIGRAWRLGDRADRRHDPATGSRRARAGGDFPLRCRA